MWRSTPKNWVRLLRSHYAILIPCASYLSSIQPNKNLKEIKQIKSEPLWDYEFITQFSAQTDRWMKVWLNLYLAQDFIQNYVLKLKLLKKFAKKVLNPLNLNPTKSANTLKRFVASNVFDHFVELALKGLIKWMCSIKIVFGRFNPISFQQTQGDIK